MSKRKPRKEKLEITKWLNTETKEVLYGINLRLGKRREWRLISKCKPVLFNAMNEAEKALREIKDEIKEYKVQ